jgi:hypothetical protein
MPFTSRASHVATAAVAILGTLVAVRGPWTAQASGNPANAANVAQAPQAQDVVYVDQYGRPLQALPAPIAPPRVVAYMTQPRPATLRSAAVRPASIVRTSPAPSVVRPVEKRRSWQKQALVIGGSAGAGAGIGALIGGKKGAAIGAALGGGGAALYTTIKK